MAAKKEVVFRADGEGVAHEDGGVDDQGTSHFTRNARRGVSLWL